MITLENVKEILHAKILCCKELNNINVESACASDMMSNVLAYAHNQPILLTGLENPQVIRTAEMMDISCVIFVRGKIPVKPVIDLAINRNIMIMSTNFSMFEACGVLYKNGLKGGNK